MQQSLGAAEPGEKGTENTSQAPSPAPAELEIRQQIASGVYFGKSTGTSNHIHEQPQFTKWKCVFLGAPGLLSPTELLCRPVGCFHPDSAAREGCQRGTGSEMLSAGFVLCYCITELNQKM